MVEILSESTEAIDGREKPWRYLALPSLEAYLLVDSRTQRLELYRRSPEGWVYQALVEGQLTLPCPQVRLDLGEVYAGVEGL